MMCPSCGTPTSGRFCGHCGALVRPRPPEPVVPAVDEDEAAADVQEPGDGPAAATPGPSPGEDAGAPPRRRGTTAAGVLAGAVAVALVLAHVLTPRPEVVTADGLAGPDGSGRTSTVAATDLTPRWDARWDGAQRPLHFVGEVTEVGPVVLVQVGVELVALMHPDVVARRAGELRDGVNLGGTLDPVLWRGPAIRGTAAAVDGRLPVVVGDELLWLSLEDGAIDARHDITTDATIGGGWPAFAVPAGGLLVTTDGEAAMAPDGTVRWRAPEPGRVTGVVGDVVVVQLDQRIVGRSLENGAEVWGATLTDADRYVPPARLVGDTVVVGTPHGRLAGYDAVSGEQRMDVALTPSAGRVEGPVVQSVGDTGSHVFVRRDTVEGPRYARVSVPGGTVEPLDELAGDELVRIDVHGDLVVTSGWQGTTAHRDGEIVWALGSRARGTGLVGDAVVAGGGGGLQVFDVATGELAFGVPATEVTSQPWRPAVLDGHAIVASNAGVESRDLATGEVRWAEPTSAAMCCPAVLVGDDAVVLRGPDVRVLDAQGGERWSAPHASAGGTEIAGLVGPWAVTHVYGRNFGDGPVTRLRSLEDGTDGPELPAESLSGLVHDRERFYARSRLLDREPAVVAYDLPDPVDAPAALEPRWTRPLGGGGQLVRHGAELLVVGSASIDHLDPATGERVGRTRLPSLGIGEAAVADGAVLRLTDGASLEAVELGTGAVRWSRELELPLAAGPTVAGDLVYVADTGSTVFGLSLRDGATVVSVDVPEIDRVRGLTVAGGHLLVGGTDTLHVLGPPPPPTTTP